MAKANGKASPGGDVGVQEPFDDLLSLVMARSRGEVGNEAVENAISSIVAAHAPSSVGGKADATVPSSSARANKDAIVPDDGNYDDDSEDDAEATSSKRGALVTDAAVAPQTAMWHIPAPVHVDKNSPERLEALEKIPLGKMGERMLITFGDGPTPDLEVISATLLGTRASLQRVILDARALRRQLKDKWHQARAAAMIHNPDRSNHELKKTMARKRSSIADNELSFRAMDGKSDKIRYDVPCGFDVSQLEILFPEEMGVYQRWKKMHEAYESSSKEVHDEDKAEAASLVKEKVETIHSGRLIERLANFDARTDKMGGDWYMKFTNVRRGSFLPRLSVRKNPGPRGSEKTIKKRGRPSTKRTSWQSLHPTSVVFLHWIGFDPLSALSPPNDETTQALGFLAYDFFGKIVEKAVSSRLGSHGKGGAKCGISRPDSPILELTGGDQLDRGNIKQALAEVDLKSLCTSSNVDLGNSAKITQLYFGPGFEDRLELEINE
ncbi:hypothetical protein ACHAWF_002056 [Thalassiosira exigua]